jgi:PAS domain S-box-containing protein
MDDPIPLGVDQPPDWPDLAEDYSLDLGWFRPFADTLGDLVWSARPDGITDYYSRSFLAYLGLTPDRTRDWPWVEALHPDDREASLRAWVESFTAGTAYAVEHRIRRRDGRYRWFRVRATPMRDAEGRVARWFGTCTDVDEQRHAQREVQRIGRDLRARDAQLRAVVDLLPIGIAVAHDPACRYMTTNESFARLLGTEGYDNISKSGPDADALP